MQMAADGHPDIAAADFLPGHKPHDAFFQAGRLKLIQADHRRSGVQTPCGGTDDDLLVTLLFSMNFNSIRDWVGSGRIGYRPVIAWAK
jgi:hypothetical protein